MKIHQGFYADLIMAFSTKSTCIFSLFSTWKHKLTIYGPVCANLPKAQHAVRKLKAEKEDTRKAIEVGNRPDWSLVDYH